MLTIDSPFSSLLLQNAAQLMRKGYELFNSGNLDNLLQMYTEGAVWHGNGTHDLASDKKGRDLIKAYFLQLAERSNKTFRVELKVLDFTVL